jgi:hypothetical protein
MSLLGTNGRNGEAPPAAAAAPRANTLDSVSTIKGRLVTLRPASREDYVTLFKWRSSFESVHWLNFRRRIGPFEEFVRELEATLPNSILLLIRRAQTGDAIGYAMGLAYGLATVIGGADSREEARVQETVAPVPTTVRTHGPPTWTLDDARRFDEFSLYWLGESFAGLPLAEISRRVYDPSPGTALELSRENSVNFFYGDCQPRPDQETGCPIPLWLKVEPNCARSTTFTPDAFPIGEARTIAGVPARYLDEGHVVLWTEDVTITIGSLGREAIPALDAAGSLEPLVGSDASVNDVLPPPDMSSCTAR